MALLFPKVDQLLKFHLALGVKHIGQVQVIDKSLSFKLLSDFGLDIGNRHIQLIQVAELLGVSDVPTVQVKNSFSHVSMAERAACSFSKFGGESHGLLSTVESIDYIGQSIEKAQFESFWLVKVRDACAAHKLRKYTADFLEKFTRWLQQFNKSAKFKTLVIFLGICKHADYFCNELAILHN